MIAAFDADMDIIFQAEVMQRWFEQYGSVVRFDVMTYTGVNEYFDSQL